MRLWTLPFRFLGIVALALLVSGGWLFRREIVRLVRPAVGAPDRALESGPAGRAEPAALARARDKVDSLHGWGADSVVLTAAEMASLVMDGLPRDARRHLDSLTVTLGEGRLTASARLESGAIPREQLGPLAGALDPWELVLASGVVRVTKPGVAEWRVDSLTLRGFTLPEQASGQLLGRALGGSGNGAVSLALPHGIADVRVRPTGVALFREDAP
jgi:hypothetical protein